MSTTDTRVIVTQNPPRRRKQSKSPPPYMSDLRIVLLGSSVSENSLVGNFILGRAAFDSEAPPDVVERVGGRLKDRHVIIINSPQLLQTNISDHQITQTVRECVNLSDPGPHVIVLLLKHEPCSAEDQECLEKALRSFSESVYQHTMVLTTQEPTETSDILQKIIQKCANRHFSLQRSSSPDDLLQTLEHIEKMNDGHYLDCTEASQCFMMEQQNTERLSEYVKLNLVVCGSDGSLKSSISDLIRQQTDRRSDVELHDRLINLLELPALIGLSEEEVMRQTLRCVSLCHPGVHAFLLIIPDTPLTDEDKAEMEEIQRIFSSRINKHIMILIKQNSEHQTAELSEETQSVIQSFGVRHHFFGPKTQVSTLMENIKQMLEENRGDCFSTETFLEAQVNKLMKYKEMKKKIHSLETHLLSQGSSESEDDLRIVLLGKTGVGKSATGNTILGREVFTAETSHESVTKESQRQTSEINSRCVTVIDTPGLFDTELSNEEIQREIRHCISMILPGPHVFIIVLSLGQRFTQEEATSVKIIQETFGEKSLMFTMVLFTRGDDLKNKTIEQFLGKSGSPLMKLIEACGNRYHMFNNNQTGERTQVTDLLEKIDNMVKENGGSFFSCKMFREMEREKQEQQMKILMDRAREKEEEMKKLEEEKERMKMMMEEERQNQDKERKRKEEEYKREMKEQEEQMRDEMISVKEEIKNEIKEMRKEIKTVKKEKENLQIRYDTETDRLMNKIENERQSHETERKRREEEFNEREERYKTLMKEKEEKEREMQNKMKSEREEWEKQKQEEKMRKEEEDEKRREKEQKDCDEFNQRLKEERERMETEKEHIQSKHKEEENKMKILMEKLNREKEELMKKHEEEKERMKMMMEEERQNQDKERKRKEEEYKREMKEQEEQKRDEMRSVKEENKNEIKEIRKEIETVKKEKENLQIRYDTETDRLMNKIENERQNHETERKRREEEFNEREERYKTLMKEKEEKEREMQNKMKSEREEWEKQKQEEKRRRKEENEKRREEEQRDLAEFNQRLKEERERMEIEKEDLRSKHKEEENKTKILMEKLNREREEEMKKLEEEKERMKMMMEEERQNQDKERKRREEELKQEIREQEKHQRETRDEMRRERETFRHEVEEMKKEKEKLQIKYDKETDKLMNRIENERQNYETERKRRKEFNEREEQYRREMKEKEREMHEEMKREREEWEKQKQEEKMRKEEEDEKRREKEQKDCDEFNQRLKEERERMETEKEHIQSKHEEEESKMKILMEKLNREKEEIMKKHEEEKERMKMMMEKLNREREEEMKKHEEEKERMKVKMEEEQQNQYKERRRREEEFKEREERYKRLIKDREEKESKMLEQMEQERMQWEKQKQDEGQKREEKKKKEEETEKQESELHKKQQSEVSDLTSGLNLVLLGIGGAGKSASGNSILGRPAFLSRKSCTSVTRDVAVESGTVDGFPVTVYDTPGLLNTYMSEDEIQQKFKRVLQKCESGSCAFLLVIKADRFTDEERKTVEKIERLLGENRLKKTWILFTGGDELEDGNMTIKEYLDETEPLKKLVQKYDQRYHVFNNKTRGASDQARLLLINILQSSLGLKDGGRLRQIHVRRNTHNEQQTDVSLSSRRIVLLGKTGVGKSASGNTILGQRVFRSELNVHSVTRECSEGHATVSGRSVSVVDTPFFDTHMNPEELMIEIVRSVYLSSPGPHAFLIVFPVNMRFTEQEQQIPQMIEILFGQEVFKYSIILFTHGDLLKRKSVKELIEENSRLKRLVDQCGGRFHVFNNRDENNRKQVNDLLQKIDSMIEQNGGGHYSNQMFEDALRFRLEEEERRLREEEERQREERRWREEKQRKQQQKQSKDCL